MNDPCCVRDGERACDLLPEFDDALEVQAADSSKTSCQGFASNHFHGDERTAIERRAGTLDVPYLVNRHDRRVIDPGSGARLQEEALHHFSVVCVLREQELECDVAV